MKYCNPKADNWYISIQKNLSKFPFSFCYGNQTYCGFSKKYFILTNKSTVRVNEKESTTYNFILKNQLAVTLLLTHYYDFGATEWTVWFENISTTNSEVLEDLKTKLTFRGKLPVLKGILGDHLNQYAPYCVDLQDKNVVYASDSGRATHGNFPYFNLEYGDGGAMLAIGWAGSWKAEFESDGQITTYTANSVNGIKTYLKPGEKIRTALFVIAPYLIRKEYFATNYWRSWFITHNLPKFDKNTPMHPFSTCVLANDTGLPNSDGSISENHTTWRPSLEKMIEKDIKIDFRWFDAGWYVAPDLTSAEPYVKGKDWWDTVGTWELDPVKWPEDSFLQSTEFARQHGMKTLVWFEPERVTYPEYLAKNFGYNPKWAILLEKAEYGRDVYCNNIGDPDCYNWTKDRICKFLRENKVELYREDNNCNPKLVWMKLDGIEGENRNGITECKIVDAHYRMWDDFIACTLSIDGCGFVDSCASGGGRNDLESMRRGVPLFRSDSDRTTTSLRLSMTHSFNRWIPFNGAGTQEKQEELAPCGISDVYVWRASYLCVLNNLELQFVQNPNLDYDNLKFGLNEWKKFSPYLLCDFYTLTPWHEERDKNSFTAFCYFDEKTQSGLILAFRMENCEQENLIINLPLGKNSTFTLTDEDTKDKWEVGNKFTLHFNQKRTSKLIWVKKTN